MEESNELGKLTLHEIFEKILGEKTDDILLKIQEAIKSGLRDEDLEAHIYRILCDAKVTEIEAKLGYFKIFRPLPQVIPYVITGH